MGYREESEGIYKPVQTSDTDTFINKILPCSRKILTHVNRASFNESYQYNLVNIAELLRKSAYLKSRYCLSI
jgi:hypothetical protein